MHHLLLWLVFLITACCFGQGNSNSSSSAPIEYRKSHYIHFSYGLGGDKNAIQFRGAFQVARKISVGGGIISTFSNASILSADPNSHAADTYLVDVGYIRQKQNTLLRLSVAPTINKIYFYGPNTGLFGSPPQIKNGVAGVMIAGEVGVCGKVGGISLSSFVNLNKEFTYGGFTFGFILGRLIVQKK